MGSPTIFAGKYTKLLTQKGLMQNGGAVNQFDGVRNYIKNSTFEANILDGWNRVKTTITSNLPTGTPTIGQSLATAPSIASFYVNGGSAPFDSYALYFGNPITTVVAGEGIISDAFTVESGDLGKVLTFKLYYKSEYGASTDNWSGVLGSQTWAVYIYDQTAGAWLQPAGFLGMNQNSGVGLVSGTFQSSVVAGQQYRIAVIALKNTTSTSALQIDNISVSSQTAPIGPVVTDWVSYTPSGTWTTNTTYTGRWRRVGDTAEVDIGLTLSGAPNATTLYVNFLPPGLAIDTSKMSVAASYIRMGYADGTKMPSAYNLKALFVNSTSVLLGYQSLLDASESVVNATAPTTWTSGSIIHLRLSFPLAGASSNVQLSNDTDTRVVACVASLSTGFNVPNTTNTKVPFDVVGKDTSAAFNTSTNTYTVPVTGWYQTNGSINMAPSAATGEVVTILYVNGSPNAYQSSAKSGTASVPFGCNYNFINHLNAGDQISIYCYQSYGGIAGVRGNNSAAQITNLNINRLSGPSVVAASETVAVSATRSAGNYPVNNSTTTFVWSIADIDTHSSLNKSTGIFVSPVSGIYEVTASCTATSLTSGTVHSVTIRINGTDIANAWLVQDSANTNYRTLVCNHVLRLNAGDQISVRIFSSNSATWIGDNGTVPRLTIKRIGN